MTDHDPLDQPFTDRLGAAFDGAAARERTRMERRSMAQRAALWTIAIALPVGALAWNGVRQSDDRATTATPPASTPATMPFADDAPPTTDRDPSHDSISGTSQPADTSGTGDESTSDPSSSPDSQAQGNDLANTASSLTTTTAQAATTTAPQQSTSEATTTPTTTVTTEAATPSQTCPDESTNDRNTLGGENGESVRPWGNGLIIAAFDATGLPASIGTGNNTIAVAGGRYGYQIDFEPSSGASETLEIEFVEPPCTVELTLSHFEVGEYDFGDEAIDESGRWTAFDSAGGVVATDAFSASDLASIGADRVLTIEFDNAVTTLRVEAIAYGEGAHPGTSPNNSDFAVRQVRVR